MTSKTFDNDEYDDLPEDEARDRIVREFAARANVGASTITLEIVANPSAERQIRIQHGAHVFLLPLEDTRAWALRCLSLLDQPVNYRRWQEGYHA